MTRKKGGENTAEQNKRYYWLKLKEDFFRQKEIKQLRKVAGGDSYTIIYLKMLLRSLRDGGKLYYEGVDADFVSELALDIDEDVENVKMTVAFLISKEILVQSNADEYALLTAGEMTGSEGYSAERMRRLRGKKMLASHSDSLVTRGDEEKEIEKEIEIDKEIESREKKRKRFIPPSVDEVKDYVKEKGCEVINAERFIAYYESNGWRVGRNPMKDWKAAVRNWAARDKEGVKTQLDRKPQDNPALNFEQREYKAEDFGDDFFINLDKYGEV